MKTVMSKENLQENQQVEKKQKLTPEVLNEKLNMVFTPRRFSVNGLRRHRGIKTSRTPRVAF